MDRMNNYYFTFGTAHVTNDGVRLQNYWVRVLAKNTGEARDKFVEQFTSIEMESPDKFAFQYNDQTFEPEYFPSGEYRLIE